VSERIPDKVVARLVLYRRILAPLAEQGFERLYSHQLADLAQGTAAQVRRDLMTVATAGSPARGYEVRALLRGLAAMLDAPDPQPVALIGIGNLGRALLSFFAARQDRLRVTAAFDVDPAKAKRTLHGCPCHLLEEMPALVAKQGIRVAILAVPAAEAQGVADLLVGAGVTGILNFAPAPIRVPDHAYVEPIDLALALEKVAFFARRERA